MGLWIRRIESNNKALLAKTSWKYLTNSDLRCSKLLKANYCPNRLLWETSRGKGDSWFWNGFVETLGFINENIGWLVGNGERIFVWQLNWIPCAQGLRKLFSSISNPNIVVKDLFDNKKRMGYSKDFEHL